MLAAICFINYPIYLVTALPTAPCCGTTAKESFAILPFAPFRVIDNLHYTVSTPARKTFWTCIVQLKREWLRPTIALIVSVLEGGLLSVV